jgi:mannose-6-phosphate isomerase-like protein (cupin superfamily)
MTIESNKRDAAFVGKSDDLEWFDTLPGEQMAYRVRSRDVDGAFTIVEALVPPRVGPPLHYHEEREEVFEVLHGILRFHCAGEEFEAGPGTTVVIPRRAIHSWVNVGSETARVLFTFVPGGADDFFPLIGRTPPDELTEIAERNDIWIVGAPMTVA